jgi:hypothetical protein
MGLIDEKTKGQKSRATVPLKAISIDFLNHARPI